ncbi:hypothetical protein KSD_81680 [Ktedonobacter sp. SOSP1-85]|nr:hypothetical protein KSD_81680 [Ktedonobacter sp. SOSP1-85]
MSMNMEDSLSGSVFSSGKEAFLDRSTRYGSLTLPQPFASLLRRIIGQLSTFFESGK